MWSGATHITRQLLPEELAMDCHKTQGDQLPTTPRTQILSRGGQYRCLDSQSEADPCQIAGIIFKVLQKMDSHLQTGYK